MYKFPETNILTDHLTRMLGKGHGPVEIISRSNFIESSTFPVEIVTCKTVDGRNYNLFCKYLAGMGPNNFGHRGGVEYEARIYQDILDKTPIAKISFYGQCRLNNNDDLLLVIEYLGETLRMLYSGEANVLNKASKWIGNFHRLQESNSPSFVTVYDKAYYKTWSDRFRKLTSSFNEKFPWLEKLANYYDDNIVCMISCPQTIIHGEFYPRNILLKDKIIYVVDWESAAIAPGEIDLASLIEGWGEDIAGSVRNEYKTSRWPDGNFKEEEFQNRLLMAQIYFHFWWWEEKADSKGLKQVESFKKLYKLYKAIK
jgi:hypothetical protein